MENSNEGIDAGGEAKQNPIPENVATKLLFRMVCALREYPFWSTVAAALALSVIWTFTWMAVFMVTTAALHLNTSAKDLIVVLWLSVAVEAIIRWAENTLLVTYAAKPHDNPPVPDNQDFRLINAALTFLALSCIILLSFLLVSDMDDIDLHLTSLIISGEHESTSNGWSTMFSSWKVTLLDTYVILAVLAAVLGRAAIYKRAHKPRE